MRVIHVVPNLVGGGAEAAVRTLSAELARRDVDVSVLSVYPSGLDADERARLGVPLIELNRHGRRDLGYFPRLVGVLGRLRPDVVHVHLHTGQYAGRVAALLARAPAIVMTIHGEEPRGALRGAADRVLHARTARFVVFTEAQRRLFAAEERVPLDRIAVIRNGVAPTAPSGSREEVRDALGLPRNAFLVYTAGRLAPEKNHGNAIQAMVRVNAPGGNRLHLVIAGDGPLSADLRARTDALGLSEFVHFLGYRRDAAALVHAMDLFVLPSFRERMPLALAEAMLAGVPAAVTPWTGAEDIVRDGDTAFVANGFSADAITFVLLRAYYDRRKRAAVAQRGREYAHEAFDVGEMGRAHVELYRGVLAAARR